MVKLVKKSAERWNFFSFFFFAQLPRGKGVGEWVAVSWRHFAAAYDGKREREHIGE